jgi:hypothetical protein
MWIGDDCAGYVIRAPSRSFADRLAALHFFRERVFGLPRPRQCPARTEAGAFPAIRVGFLFGEIGPGDFGGVIPWAFRG